MAQLASLWTANVFAIKALPEDLRKDIVRAKDETKARVQQAS